METELRLGLPGNGGGGSREGELATRKRGFSETVDLKLNLSSKDVEEKNPNDEKSSKTCPSENKLKTTDPAKPPAKAQVVGWPPVGSFRKNMLGVQKSSNNKENEKLSGSVHPSFVKVSMDGAPYLRKVDLKMHKNYRELSDALTNMFASFSSPGKCGYTGMKEFLSENKLKDVDMNGTDYVPTYEDKDGDWMLVGDVPWEMFVESCKRLRIMKATEATGLGPRAMEKRKNRS